MNTELTADALRAMDLAQLDEVYRASPCAPLPLEGVFFGTHLGWMEHPLARCRGLRLLLSTGFKWPPFGLDWGSRCWFFGHPRLQTGRFAPEPGPSRWREAETVRLSYDPSRLPAPLRALLYDEVKPLGPDLCLGIGGINAPRGRGELFYFALERR